MDGGTIGILNVGAGDTKLSFDPSKPEERKRAAKAVTEMLRLGFAILVEVGRNDRGPLFQRIDSFDEATCEYIIVGAPADDVDIPGREEVDGVEGKRTGLDDGPPLKRANVGRPKKGVRTRVPAETARSVAVPRSAGG